ncbi:hypothetical protein [Haloferax denitrificans]|uniref:Transmembrane protein n=1 Tax=Haloferax denitrificans ATCC 35960 TaxID=662478 RepID=M0IWS2_9EURY|nr:hypothetical protein [Haloferax denitrificans]EMA00244.1 hypothetical protein C438_17330 [Haloferax denitrificans ATCC 35960]
MSLLPYWLPTTFPHVLVVAVPLLLILLLVGGLAAKTVVSRVLEPRRDLERRVAELEAQLDERSDE